MCVNLSMITTIQEYNEYIKECQSCFILYHNPWCKISQRMESELHKASTLIHNTFNKPKISLNYSLGVLDMTMVNTQHLQLQLNSFPLLVYMDQGNIHQTYMGEYKKKEIFLFIIHSITKVSRGIIQINTKKELKTCIKIIDNVLLIITQKELKPTTIVNKANSLIIQSFTYNIYNTTVLNSNQSQLVTFYKGKEINRKMINNFNMIDDEITSFNEKKIKQNNFYSSINEHVINELIMKKNKCVILFRSKYDNQTESIEQYIKFNMTLLNPDIMFIITDITNKLELKLIKLLKIDQYRLPQLRYIAHKDNQLIKYQFNEQKLTQENVCFFIMKCLNNSNLPYFNSEDRHLSSNSTIKLISRLNLNYYLYHYSKEDKPFVLLIYTDWCIYSKKVLFHLVIIF